MIVKILQEKGIYEVVPDAEVVKEAGAGNIPKRRWLAQDLALVKQVGRAVKADFAIIKLRESSAERNYISRVICLNLWTGKTFNDTYMIAGSLSPEQFSSENVRAFQVYSRKMFQQFKDDLLKIALQKGRSTPEATPMYAMERSFPDMMMEMHDAVDRKARGESSLPLLEEPGVATVMPPIRKVRPGEKTRLVIYDFNSQENLSTAALILAEALREELMALGYFVLVNREDMVKMTGEMKLQHSGLVNEKQAVTMGKGLAAHEAVTGRLYALGNTYVLQVKRTDIETMATLAIASLKCPAGREDDLLEGMPRLAKKIGDLK